MTADPRALYPCDTEDQAVLRPLTRKQTVPPYERARLAAGAPAVRVNAARRAASKAHPWPFRTRSNGGRQLEPETGVDTVEQTRRTFEPAARPAARLQDGKRERAVARGPRPRPAPVTASQPHTQRPGAQHTSGWTPGGPA
ncbi:hypothetical protein [Streptomyces misionensis]